MADKDVPTIIDQAVEGLDTVTTVLAKVGIDLGPFAGQVVLLVLTFALLGLARKKIYPVTTASSIALVPLIVAAGILISWVYQLAVPLPDHVFGRVVMSDRPNLSVAVRDFRGHIIPPGISPVDSLSGDFAIRFNPSFGDHPRAILVYAVGCETYSHPITRMQIVVQSPVDIQYVCKEKST